MEIDRGLKPCWESDWVHGESGRKKSWRKTKQFDITRNVFLSRECDNKAVMNDSRVGFTPFQ